MKKWKTYLLLCIMQSSWLSEFLVRTGRGVHDTLLSPDPNVGDALHWECLGDPSEMARYGVIVGYARRLRPKGSVLDVGSSNGVLAEEIKNDVSLYHGIERDPASVERAKARNIPVAAFFVADANSYSTSDAFDVIVFNETIYYLNDPIRLLHRYSGYLKPDGVIIISTWLTRSHLRIPLEIAKHFEMVDQTTVVNAQGNAWVIQAVRRPHVG